jgi:hypothetical protein
MKIDLTHQSPFFTQAELKSLAEEDRILVPGGIAPGQAQFPYLVLSGWPSQGFADGWWVNDLGEKDPSGLTPMQVSVEGMSRLDVSDPELRRPMQAFIAKRADTIVFGIPNVARNSDAYYVRALGTGSGIADARRDAASRLKARFPQLFKEEGDKSLNSVGEAYKALMAALNDRSASALHRQSGWYPTQEKLGHEYMSVETHDLAQSLTSNYDVCERVANEKNRDINTLRGAISAAARRVMAQCDFDEAMIDWTEVVGSFPESVADREVVVARSSVASEAPVAESPASGRMIDAAVLEVLRASVVDGHSIRLPGVQLDPKLYKKVNEVLVALGGKWVGGKVRAHRFEIDPAAVLEVAVSTGTYVRPQDFGYFPTPVDLVERVLDLAEIEPGMTLLEPSAGRGAFAVPMAQMVGDKASVTVCELLPSNLAKLREAGFESVLEGDFLTMEPEPIYDRVVMNPPFNGGSDIEHVMHAARFLKPDGVLLAITGVSWAHNTARKFQDFRDFVEQVEGQVQEVASGAFKEAGTNVATRIIRMDAANFPWNQQAETSVSRERING